MLFATPDFPRVTSGQQETEYTKALIYYGK